MKKITLNMTENTPKSREKLTKGYAYIINFHDAIMNQEKIASGIWNGECFKYTIGRFWPGTDPQPENSHNLILGFYRLIDWDPPKELDLRELENYTEDGRE